MADRDSLTTQGTRRLLRDIALVEQLAANARPVRRNASARLDELLGPRLARTLVSSLLAPGYEPMSDVMFPGDPIRLIRATNGTPAGSEGEVVGWRVNDPETLVVRLWDGGVQKVPREAVSLARPASLLRAA